jgi:hypothetical protein
MNMNKIGLITGVLLGVLAPAAMAQEVEGQRIARVCAGDFERLCAGRSPMPTNEDFQAGHTINQCLKEHLSQLSPPCSSVIMGGGR